MNSYFCIRLPQLLTPVLIVINQEELGEEWIKPTVGLNKKGRDIRVEAAER